MGIIGVVAALTIPSVMNKTNDKETVTALKKAYSTLSQAYTMAVAENGTPDGWGLVSEGDSTGATNILTKFTNYMKVLKNCGTTDMCFTLTPLILSGGSFGLSTNSHAKAVLANGNILGVYSYGDCTSISITTEGKTACGSMYMDINGDKNPNRLGKDIFGFYLTQQGIVPMGGVSDNTVTTGFNSSCNKASKPSGFGCTAWVIQNENLDYLKCPGQLSWNGSTTCP